MINLRYIAATVVLLFSLNCLFAQEASLNSSKHRVGGVVGVGNQLWLDVDYHYGVNFYQLQYYRSVLGRESWSLDILFQPQYNRTKYRPVDNIPHKNDGFELGLNVGLLIRKNLMDDFISIYSLVSLGPHYVSGTPKRQADGFIFSDNLFVGFNIMLYENIYLDIRPGFRHISNAGLKRPNGGVNNAVISAGILVNL